MTETEDFFDRHWTEIAADPEGWARSVAPVLPIEHPGAAIEAAAVRHGMTEQEGRELFDRLFSEWKRCYSGAEEAASSSQPPGASSAGVGLNCQVGGLVGGNSPRTSQSGEDGLEGLRTA